mmetsp:Transcript_18168/g.41223  ORF Transcript_18168/g.41223 Transcript_18168/m.41223 type:complete len:255 (-) Transcript_18168:387-1151(-)
MLFHPSSSDCRLLFPPTPSTTSPAASPRKPFQLRSRWVREEVAMSMAARARAVAVMGQEGSCLPVLPARFRDLSCCPAAAAARMQAREASPRLLLARERNWREEDVGQEEGRRRRLMEAAAEVSVNLEEGAGQGCSILKGRESCAGIFTFSMKERSSSYSIITSPMLFSSRTSVRIAFLLSTIAAHSSIVPLALRSLLAKSRCINQSQEVIAAPMDRRLFTLGCSLPRTRKLPSPGCSNKAPHGAVPMARQARR